jgi:hypothetical protein
MVGVLLETFAATIGARKETDLADAEGIFDVEETGLRDVAVYAHAGVGGLGKHRDLLKREREETEIGRKCHQFRFRLFA